MSEIGVIVAHPDDEVLAFGATMARHAAGGDNVHILILATGLASRTGDGSVAAEELADLRRQSSQANKMLGATSVEFDDFPDNRMDIVAQLDVIKRVESFVEKHRPEIIYTHHVGDLNVDHVSVATAVLTAARPLAGAPVKKIYAGEVLSSSEFAFPERRFVPNSYVDITGFVDRKCAALEAYTMEIRDWPHPRSVEAVRALAALRGSEVGCDAAEALCLVRETIK